jgi:hypothetical protein
MATKKDIFDILQKIKYLPNSPMTKENAAEIVDMFFVILKDLSFDLLEKAALYYLGQGNPFFPMPGALRQKALELQMIALRIPTATEAWGMVINRKLGQPGVICETAHAMETELKSLSSAGVYLSKIKDLNEHEKTCSICKAPSYEPVYEHALVGKTVHLLGGLDVLLTDNPVSDRARFVQAYQEILERERSIVGMVPEVKQFVQDERQAALETGERQAVFDTGEKKLIERQMKETTSRMALR